MRKFLGKIPDGVFTIIFICLILYATLFPQPLPVNNGFFFPGMDKIVHFIMFFVLSIGVWFDYAKKIYPKRINMHNFIWCALLIVGFGGLIEILQGLMGLGRTASWGDFIADAIGAIIGIGLSSSLLDNYYTKIFYLFRKK